jgi:hypothetical protein
MVEIWEKIANGEIDEEIIEMAKNEVLNRWRNEGYDVDEIKKIDIDEFLSKFNIEENKKKLIKEILNEGIKKDIIIAFVYGGITIKLINGLVIYDLDKMSLNELMLLYKKIRTADLKKLFFTKKNLFLRWH